MAEKETPNLVILTEKLAVDIVERRKKELSARIKVGERKSLILSDISDCDRQMVYSVLNWQDRQMFNADVQARLDVGNLMEREIKRELEGYGYEIIRTQERTEVRGRGGDVIATGKIEGFFYLRDSRASIPFEIKTMQPNMFNQIDCVEDFQEKPWLRKYTRQLMMYLFGHNCEAGIFIITDCLGHWKLFVLYLDLGECELILQRLEKDYAKIKANELPERIPYDPQMCQMCSFNLICLPDVKNIPAEMWDREELGQDIQRYLELKDAKSEAEGLWNKFKAIFNGLDKVVVCGKYLAQNIQTKKVKYILSEETEAKVKELKKQIESICKTEAIEKKFQVNLSIMPLAGEVKAEE